jgi:TonB family protein
MRAYSYPNLLKAYYFLCKAMRQPQYRLLVALVLSTALHAGIIFLTTTGQGAKIQGKSFLKELRVNITNVAPPSEVVPQLQDKSDSEPSEPEMPPIDSAVVQPEPGGVLQLAEEHYYKIKELDVAPRPIFPITPRYPEAVPSSIRRGVVQLEIKLDEEGLVTEVTVLDGEPPGYFEDAAREAFLHAKFTPGMKSGLKVRSLFTLRVHFENAQNP